MNHADCHSVMCERARQKHPSCQTCCHWHDGICGLTGTSAGSVTETKEGCCHHNAELVTGVVLVSEVWIPDEGGAYRVEAESELAWAGIGYERVEGGATAVCVADCIPPVGRYGVGGGC